MLEWAKTGEGPLPEVITTDSFERGLRSADPLDPVMNCDVETALARFKPHVVIVGFMPLGVDWTAAFRACPSVRSYLSWARSTTAAVDAHGKLGATCAMAMTTHVTWRCRLQAGPTTTTTTTTSP